MSLEPLASERPTLPPPEELDAEVPRAFKDAARELAGRLGLDTRDMLTIAGEAVRIALRAWDLSMLEREDARIPGPRYEPEPDE